MEGSALCLCQGFVCSQAATLAPAEVPCPAWSSLHPCHRPFPSMAWGPWEVPEPLW